MNGTERKGNAQKDAPQRGRARTAPFCRGYRNKRYPQPPTNRALSFPLENKKNTKLEQVRSYARPRVSPSLSLEQ